MSEISWSNLGGDFFEKIVAVLLNLEYPNAGRMRTSSIDGDRGIDIFVPNPTANSLIVFQAKCFTSPLKKGNKKSQIINSHKEAISRWSSRIEEWHLVVPFDHVPTEFDWFESNISNQSNFPCFWNGLTFLDGLAAKYPEVISYYLGDGERKINSAIEKLTSLYDLFSRVRTDSPPLRSSEIVNQLQDLHSLLNVDDPQYRYDLHIVSNPPPSNMKIMSDMIVSRKFETIGDTCIVTDLIARYRHATEDRPIPMGGKVIIPRGSETEFEFERYLEYGLPVTLEIHDMHIDAPGGFGGNFEKGILSINPPDDKNTNEVCLAKIIDDDNNTFAQLILDLEQVVLGLGGGSSRRLIDKTGTLQILVLRNVDGKFSLELTFDGEKNTNKPLDTVLTVLKFASEVKQGRHLIIENLTNEVTTEKVTFSSSIPQGVVLMHELGINLKKINLLLGLDLRIPINFDTELIKDVKDTRRLLEGEEVVRRWTKLETTIQLNANVDDDLLSKDNLVLSMKGSWLIDVNGSEVEVANVIYEYGPARLEKKMTNSDGNIVLKLAPTKDLNVMTIRQSAFENENESI